MPILLTGFFRMPLVPTSLGYDARVQLLHEDDALAVLVRATTGDFGSSATPTVNAPIQKVQTGGFGDPNGLPGTGKEGAHLQAALPRRANASSAILRSSSKRCGSGGVTPKSSNCALLGVAPSKQSR